MGPMCPNPLVDVLIRLVILSGNGASGYQLGYQQPPGGALAATWL
jgi:hypothetical protein